MAHEPVRVLVVDDTIVYRKIVSETLRLLEGIEVVGSASNGKAALQKIEELHPDVVTLDLEMPVMNGLEVLQRLKEQPEPHPGVIMLSAFTTDGANATMKALDLGAFDFILKPSGDNINQNINALRNELNLKIKACVRSRQVRAILHAVPERPATHPATPVRIPPPKPGFPPFAPLRKQKEVIVIGVSTGGPQALTKTLPLLPRDLPLPVLIVQHMPPIFTKSLADDLNRRCKLPVCEACHGQPIKEGQIYIAPGGKQMKAGVLNNQKSIILTDDPPENSCRPAVDYLFRSIALCYEGKAIGVIMTGMGSDGTLGCRLLKQKGATIITQDEATCTVYGMPRQPAEEGLSDFILPLLEIPEKLIQLTRQKVLI